VKVALSARTVDQVNVDKGDVMFASIVLWSMLAFGLGGVAVAVDTNNMMEGGE